MAKAVAEESLGAETKAERVFKRLGMLDLNGDGKIDRKDLYHAMKVAGITVSAGAAAVGVTAAASATAGAALVSSTASTIGTSIAVAGGTIAGAAAGLYAGTTSFVLIHAVKIGSVLFVESAVVSSVSSATVLAWSSVTGAAAAALEIASGTIAGLPIVKAAALSALQASGQVIVIGGVAFSTNVAIASGAVLAVVAAGVVYYVLTKEGQEKLESNQLEEFVNRDLESSVSA